LEVLYRETEALYQGSKVSEKICHLRNKINVGYLIIKMARKRKESRGLHFNIDFPDKLES
jgi:L-aspartate oxidase